MVNEICPKSFNLTTVSISQNKQHVTEKIQTPPPPHTHTNKPHHHHSYQHHQEHLGNRMTGAPGTQLWQNQNSAESANGPFKLKACNSNPCFQTDIGDIVAGKNVDRSLANAEHALSVFWRAAYTRCCRPGRTVWQRPSLNAFSNLASSWRTLGPSYNVGVTAASSQRFRFSGAKLTTRWRRAKRCVC